MENVILHSTPLKDFQEIIGELIEAKLKQFQPVTPPQTQGEYLTAWKLAKNTGLALQPSTI